MNVFHYWCWNKLTICIEKYSFVFLYIHYWIVHSYSFMQCDLQSCLRCCLILKTKKTYPSIYRNDTSNEGSEHVIYRLYAASEAHFLLVNVITKHILVLFFFIITSSDEQQIEWCFYVDHATTWTSEYARVRIVENWMKMMETKQFRSFL